MPFYGNDAFVASEQSFIKGEGAPSSAQGIDGSIYLDTLNKNIYGPKLKGQWPAGVSLVVDEGAIVVGPAGAQGLKGDVGEQGVVGPQGLTGIAGPQGLKGDSGLDSTVPGPKGDAGTAGISGLKGDTGNPGIQGPIGLKGDTGLTGNTGAKGDTGNAGPAGAASTVPGPTGPTGAQGPVGPSGAASTVPGPQGIKGDTGATGVAGSTKSFNMQRSLLVMPALAIGTAVDLTVNWSTAFSDANYTILIVASTALIGKAVITVLSQTAASAVIHIVPSSLVAVGASVDLTAVRYM